MERMRLLRTISYAPFILAGAILLTSCTTENAPGGEVNAPAPGSSITSMEQNAVIDYETPVQLPGIIVDRVGYSSQEVKYAWVVAAQMPACFDVVDEKSGEVVFQTEPESVVYNSETGVYYCKIKFGDVVSEGTYHIEESSLGQSYSFAIEDDYYISDFDDFLADEMAKCEDLSITAEEVYSLAYIGERYSFSIDDATKLWESVGKWLEAVDTTGVDADEAGLIAAIYAKTSFNYTSTDSAMEVDGAKDLADAWKIKAEEIYSGIADLDGELAEDTDFLALAELYRLTGKGAYASDISDMYDYINGLDDIHTSRKYLYGSMCYMNTHRTVNRNLCDLFMQSLLMSCEEISWDKTLIAPQNANRTETDVLLDYAQQLIAMNYVLDGYQYNELVVSIEHYMSGRNYEGYLCNIKEEYPEDAIVIMSWLALLEKNGKLDPSAPVEWEYSW